MRLGVLAVCLVLLGCGTVTEDESVPIPEAPEPPRADFSRMDSIYLAGGFNNVRDSLLLIAGTDTLNRDQALFRLLGLYHGRAMEDEFILALEGLEMDHDLSLWGWKVSALSMAREPGRAILHVPTHRPLLRSWLRWLADSVRAFPEAPSAMSPGDIYCLSVISDSGSVDPSTLEQMVPYIEDLPTVRQVFIREMAFALDTAGVWWDSLHASAAESGYLDQLLLRRMDGLEPLPLSEYIRMQREPGPLCTLSVSQMMLHYPAEYSPSWKVVEYLVLSGAVTLARDYSTAGDIWHRTGCDMMILLQRDAHSELLSLCESIGSDAPDSLRALAAFMRAEALRIAGRGGTVSYPAYLHFAMNYPWHPLAREAAYNAGKYYDCEQEWENSADAYLISLGTSGTFGGDERAHWRGGFTLYMSGRTLEADSLWEAGCRKWPHGYWRDEMLFWRARLAGESGDVHLRDSLMQDLVKDHPWEFYGLLASRRTAIPVDLRFPVPPIHLGSDPVCSLAVELTSEGYGVAALQLLQSSPDGDRGMKAAAMSLMGSHGHALSALRVLDTDLRDSMVSKLPDTLLAFYFPAPYSGLSLSATDTLQLSASTLQGIMREESYFNRWVVSSAGARGVVQLMPSTAYDVARWYDLPQLEESQFFDPFLSVPYGAIYIDRQRDAFSGELPLFLAAYNAGPGNASRWVDMHGWNPADPESYIEQITYRETRMYVKKVLRSSWIYERY